MNQRVALACVLSLSFAVAGCPSNPAPTDTPMTGDTGPTDAGRDTGMPDGGVDAPVDAGGTDVPMDDAPVAVCGNSMVEGTEACDDGDTDPGDGCDASCAIEMGWSCDDAMPSVCTSDCGNSALNGTEECDDGGNVDGDGCSMACAVEDGWTCDTAEPSVCSTTCGDGTPAGDEACDDGNTADETACAYGTMTCTGCSADCSVSADLTGAYCGDGNTDLADGETCDDSNATAGDGCSDTCTLETDCGDGVIEGVEVCDDGGTVDGDGCSAVCAVETGYVCSGEPSTCGRTCVGLANAIALNCASGTVMANTVDGTDAVGEYACTTFSYPNNEQVWSFTNETGGLVEVEIVATRGASTRDADLYVLEAGGTDTCEATACVDSSTGTGAVESVVFPADSGTAVFVAYDIFSTPDGATTDYTLQVTCTPIVCGDGVVGSTEECDDDNADAGDGCSDTCTVEAGFNCDTSVAPTVCTPVPYLVTPITAACVDTTTGTSLSSIVTDDAVTASAALPFAFTYFGAAVTNWVMSSNGNLQLITDAGDNEWSNTSLPDSGTPNSTVAAFWDDLLVTGTPAAPTARVITVGTAPNRVFVAEWANYRPTGAPSGAGMTFQAMLYETTDVIEFHYCDIVGTDTDLTGVSATIGVENADGTDAVEQASFVADAIAEGAGFRFTPNP